MKNSNEYMRQYMADRRAKRKQQLIEMLGGHCARCEVTDELDFDHIDPKTKSFQISGRALDKPWALLLEEVAKCQLLCRPHHLEKSLENGDLRNVEHGGGLTGKKNCPCTLCKARKSEYMKKYMLDYVRPGRAV